MPEDNIKSFTIQWMIIGLLIFCMLGFAFTFIYANSDQGFETAVGNKLNESRSELRTKILAVNEDSDLLLNITAQTDPEVSQLGSRDSVATSYKYREEATSNWDKLKSLIGWVLTGDAGKILISVLGGMLAYLSVYYIIKFIRTGS